MLSPMILMALGAIAVLVFASIRRIPEGQVYTLRRVGGHTRVMHSGMSGEKMRGRWEHLGRCQAADRVIDGIDGLLQERTRSLFADAALPESSDSRRQWLKQSLNSDIRDRGLLVTRVDLAALN